MKKQNDLMETVSILFWGTLITVFFILFVLTLTAGPVILVLWAIKELFL